MDLTVNVSELREQVASCCRFLSIAGVMDDFGHLSARLPAGKLLVSPLGVTASAVRPADILTVDLDGRRLEGEGVVPGEVVIHTRIYRARTDLQSILHYHPHYVNLCGIAGLKYEPVYLYGVVFRDGVGLYDDPELIRRPEQGDAVAGAMGQCAAVILRGHGAVVAGETVQETLCYALFLEENAKMLYQASLAGKARAFTQDEIDRCYQSFWATRLAVRRVWLGLESRAKRAEG